MTIKTGINLLVAAALIVLAAPGGAGAESIRFGFYPSRERGEVERAAKEFCAYVSKATGLSVVPVVSKNYTQGVGDLTEGRVDVAWLSPMSVVSAEGTKRARVLLRAVRHDAPFYWGAVIVRKDSGINTLDDLKDKSFGWTDPTSTAGHLITKAALIRAGIQPENDFASNQFTGGHDRLCRSVYDKVVAAGATFGNDPEKGEGAWTVYLKPEEAAEIKAIFFTEPIPGDAVAGSAAFLERSKENAERLVASLTKMGEDPAGKALLEGLYNIDRLAPAESRDYDAVRLSVEALRGGTPQ